MGSARVRGDLWSADTAGWTEIQEPSQRQLYDVVLPRALKNAVHESEVLRLLDVTEVKQALGRACASGVFAEIAAKAGAQVTGLDAAPARRPRGRRAGGGAPPVRQSRPRQGHDRLGADDVGDTPLGPRNGGRRPHRLPHAAD